MDNCEYNRAANEHSTNHLNRSLITKKRAEEKIADDVDETNCCSDGTRNQEATEERLSFTSAEEETIIVARGFEPRPYVVSKTGVNNPSGEGNAKMDGSFEKDKEDQLAKFRNIKERVEENEPKDSPCDCRTTQ